MPTGAKGARHEVEQGSTLEGATYEDKVSTAMYESAAGLGDDFVATGTKPGARTTSKKGDGVLDVAGSEAAVVLEMIPDNVAGVSGRGRVNARRAGFAWSGPERVTAERIIHSSARPAAYPDGV